MPEEITVLGLERLPRPPGDPSADRVYWEAEVMSDNEGPYSIYAWVTGTDAIRVPGEHWVRSEIEALGQTHDIAELYALSEIQLHPPPA